MSMVLKTIHLTNFRNFTNEIFSFHKSLTIIIGDNARGKTNLLEGIYTSLYGSGFRESKEEELIYWDMKQALVESEWRDKEEIMLFQIAIDEKNDSIEKKYYVNKTKKAFYSYFQYQERAVLFAPEHIDIVTGSPDKRRDYFNRLIASHDPEYKKSFHSYEHALYRRNKILEFHSYKNTLKDELAFWNEYLERHGGYLTLKRQEYIDYLNKHSEIDGKNFHIKYIKNELTQVRLEESYEEEQRIKRTLIGPQKDDFHIYLKNEEDKNIHHFGSRSEQRLGVFWLKLNEIRYLENYLKKKPLLLLDDIFSELDTKNKKIVLNLIGEYQTILTTTEKELLDLSQKEKFIITL